MMKMKMLRDAAAAEAADAASVAVVTLALAQPPPHADEIYLPPR